MACESQYNSFECKIEPQKLKLEDITLIVVGVGGKRKKFVPLEDITAYELSFALRIMLLGMNPRNIYPIEVIDQFPPGAERHWIDV